MQPSEINVQSDRMGMEIVWPDGHRRRLSAAGLRAISKSARSEHERLTGDAREIAETLSISGVEPIGVYAVNIKFSDGYAKGIYPWAMLRNAEVPELPEANSDQKGN